MTIRQAPNRTFSALVSGPDWGGRITRAEVSLDAVVANVRALRAVARSPEFMAAVKADAYGHGSVAVARAALDGGATWLGVYTVSEGVQLRLAGITAPILVFGPFTRSEARQLVRRGLTPSIWSVDAAVTLQEASGGVTIGCHIKLDTGLNRSGIEPEEAVSLLDALQNLPDLKAEGIFTHFACADEPSHPENARQHEVFLRSVDRLERAGHHFSLRHAANTAATLGLPHAHLDMVRCGIGIYGYYPSAQTPRTATLAPALSLVSAVTRLQDLPAGAGVGYGHEHVCARATRIALAPIGYGDGLPRSLGRGAGSVLIHGVAAPIVGRVSMDQITIDVGGVPGVQIGDPVVLIGASGEVGRSADDLAADADTISHEILTGLMPRVPRLYARGGRLIAG
jgi:alanine racemase